jgi:hypothetical protein
MKIFHCDHCGQPVFFENSQCVKCQHVLAYLPDRAAIGALERVDVNVWRSLAATAEGATYRLCRNYSEANVCNWALAAADPRPLCRSCRLTRIIPDLGRSGHQQAWYRLEVAKRRLLYTLLGLGLPVVGKENDPVRGLAFQFLADPDPGVANGASVLTGHKDGVITINVAEADDAEREKRRQLMQEPYRTLLGHFRHEIGHYYWDRLVKDTDWVTAFRHRFGDERADYAQALKRHYREGARADWPEQFISAYASSHPWEDWAETWAHYLHMTDSLETAAGCGLSLQPRCPDEPALNANLLPHDGRPRSFDAMIASWFALTNVLNNFNRGLGLPDAYPFILSTPVIEKLRFVHEVTLSAAAS